MPTKGYIIVPNFFAPKCSKYIVSDNPKNIHAISYGMCNFKCNYCSFSQKSINGGYYLWKDEKKFANKINELLPLGNSFKFTGGEPTINPFIERDISLVKNMGGIVYLDTNGSNDQIIKSIIEKNLVDVLAVSIKGLDKEETIKRSGCSSTLMCWDNVWRTIEIGSNNKYTDVIITYVCTQFFCYKKLCKFARMLSKYKNVYLKINNYQEDNGMAGSELKHYNDEQLEIDIKRLIAEFPEWKNRVIVIHNSSAIQHFEKVQLF